MIAIEQCATGFASFSLAQEKVCGRCGETKRLAEFILNPKAKNRGGRGAICKPCANSRTKEWQRKNAEKLSLARVTKDCTQHYGSDEKFGETWKDLDAVLRNITYMRVTPLQKAA